MYTSVAMLPHMNVIISKFCINCNYHVCTKWILVGLLATLCEQFVVPSAVIIIPRCDCGNDQAPLESTLLQRLHVMLGNT